MHIERTYWICFLNDPPQPTAKRDGPAILQTTEPVQTVNVFCGS